MGRGERERAHERGRMQSEAGPGVAGDLGRRQIANVSAPRSKYPKLTFRRVTGLDFHVWSMAGDQWSLKAGDRVKYIVDSRE